MSGLNFDDSRQLRADQSHTMFLAGIVHHMIDLLISFAGRISRRSWWLGVTVVSVLSIVAGLLIDGYGATIGPIVAYAAICLITFRRLKDRGHPQIVGYLWALMATALFGVLWLGAFHDPLSQPLWLWAFAAISIPFGLWVFIDCAFLEGTPGPNRYGVPRVGPKQRDERYETVDREPSELGRSTGAYIRDGLVGAVALAIAFVVAGPSPLLARWASQVIELTDRLTDQAEKSPIVSTSGLIENPEAWGSFISGNLAARQGRYRSAIRHYNRAARSFGMQNPASAQVLAQRGHAYRSLGRQHRALLDYSAAIALDPTDARRYYLRSEARAGIELYEDALSDCDRAVELAPNVAVYHVARANPLSKLGRVEEAIASYERAIALTKRSLHERVRPLANSTLFRPNVKEALLASIAKPMDLAIARAQVGRAVLLRDNLRSHEALAAFDEAIRTMPDYAPAFRHRGWLHETEGRFAEALSDYRKAAALQSLNPWLSRAIERAQSRMDRSAQ